MEGQRWLFLLEKSKTMLPILWFLCKAYISGFFIIPLVAVYQERRLWKPPNLPRLSLWGMIKVYLFVTSICLLSQLGSLLLLPWYLLGFDMERLATVGVERWAAVLVVSVLLGPVEIVGKENLPPPNDDAAALQQQQQQQQQQKPKGVVYIANHNSQIDGAAVYFMKRRFRLILKQSIIFLPGLGLLTIMARHIFIDRDKTKNKTNVQRMYAECSKALQSGKSIFLFPQGTRQMVQRLPFKDGAFNIAKQAEVPIVPISIHIPKRAWNDAYPFNLLWNRKIEPVVLTIHKPVSVTRQSDKEELKESCFHTIYSALPSNVDLSKKTG